MSKIISIATGTPAYKHMQNDLFGFADKAYSKNESDSRKLRFLYNKSGINSRYSVLPDFTSVHDGQMLFENGLQNKVAPGIGKRMKAYNDNAANLSAKVIGDCINGHIDKDEITHLITVSCTGMSAPGLDLQLVEQMGLSKNINRTSVNFMGCYAAIHAMKLADAFCCASSSANVVIVCTELCTLHFQKEISEENLTSSLLFGDGCAAMLVQNNTAGKGLRLHNFFSEVHFKGKQDMAWEISSTGFLMTLSGYIPDLIKENFSGLAEKALTASGMKKEDISYWCMHPGGKKILEAIAAGLDLNKEDLAYSYDVLRDYGNMSSPTILFVLEKILAEMKQNNLNGKTVFGAAFGPGLTMETFTAVYD